MRTLVRWLLTDPSVRQNAPRDLPDLQTRVERGITSLLAINPSENDS